MMRTVYVRWSSSDVYRMTFVKWCRMRMSTGGEDTNKLGWGGVVHSTWLFSRELMEKIPHGLKRGYYRIRPYTKMFLTYRGARTGRGRYLKRQGA